MKPSPPFVDQLPGDNYQSEAGYLRDTLTQMGANISAGFLAEHNADDTHSTIHASGPISERGRTVPMGAWINVPFDATIFSVAGAGNSWVVPSPTAGGPIATLSHTVIGTTVFLNVDVHLSALTIATPTDHLTIRLPSDIMAANLTNSAFQARTCVGKCRLIDNSTVLSGDLILLQTTGIFSTTLLVERSDAGNFVSDLSNFTVQGQVFYELKA